MNLLNGMLCLVAQSCVTLCDPVDYGLPGSSVHGILQARVLEWVAISFPTHSRYIFSIHTLGRQGTDILAMVSGF